MDDDTNLPKGEESKESKAFDVIEGGKSKASKAMSSPTKGTTKQGLTAKQEAFCQNILKGMTNKEAYRQAYDAANMSDSSVWTEVSKMLRNPKIALRLEALKADWEEKQQHVGLSRRQWIIERLEAEAETASSDAARIRALELLGKIPSVGLFKPDDEADELAAMQPEQIRAKLTKLLKAKTG